MGLSKSEILNGLISLSHSQGFYGRLLNSVYENDKMDEFLTILEEQKPNDLLDVILYLES